MSTHNYIKGNHSSKRYQKTISICQCENGHVNEMRNVEKVVMGRFSNFKTGCRINGDEKPIFCGLN